MPIPHTTLMRNILLLCPDLISERMAGPAIRYWEFASALATAGHRVTLAMPNPVPQNLPSLPGVYFEQHRADNISALCANQDILIAQGMIVDLYPTVRHTDKILVCDLYDPVPLETLEQQREMPLNEALPYQAGQVDLINRQLKYADYFLCASERQKDFWLGALLSLGRINPLTYQDMASRILRVPFGLPDSPPTRTAGSGIREHPDEFILLWGGGIWEWFDPLTIIRAVHSLRDEQPDLKLVFLGTRHPNPGIPPMPMQQRAEALAHELGVFGKQVIFRPGWVPYAQLQNYFLDADVGVSAHFNTLETRYAFRTRILYYLWANKPILTTEGDILAQAVLDTHAGFALPAEDEQAWVAALRKLRQIEHYAACSKGSQTLASQYTWHNVTQPLHTLCTNLQPIGDINAIDSGIRSLQGQDWEVECHVLAQYIAEMKDSTSWRVTAPLRYLKHKWQYLRRR